MRELQKLDLLDYIAEFRAFFAREKDIGLLGDIKKNYKFITELQKYDLSPMPQVKPLDDELKRLEKSGLLSLNEIFEFVKIVRYFFYLKRISFEGVPKEWIDSIEIPSEISEIATYFDDRGELEESLDERLISIRRALKENKEAIKERLRSLSNSPKLAPYLVDRQIHYVNEEETLLVRGGFAQVLKGTVAGRSSGGFFYVAPEEILKLKEKEAALLSRLEEIKREWAKKISSVFHKWVKFLSFIDKEFDRFDHYRARILFAKSKNLNIILPKDNRKIVLKGFEHPALKDPKPVDVDFEGKVLIITGVNAGGKTMLLKSILGAAFLASELIPMKIDPKSSIGNFKKIIPIIEDPQNVKNDISTFAGRMMAFSELLSQKEALIGVDEIELGTDSDEAATLFKVLLDELMKRDLKIVLTTHHKRLAALMAENPRVDLVAALYDEERGVPTYKFLQGIIGKSYAFETAARYGIPKYLIKRAEREFGEDRQKISKLIERGSELQRELSVKNEELQRRLDEVKRLKESLERERDFLHEELRREKERLSLQYNEAVKMAREAIKAKEVRESHRLLNRAAKSLENVKIKPKEQNVQIEPGDTVRYKKSVGEVVSIKKKEALVDFEGIRMRVPVAELKPAKKIKKRPKAHLSLTKSAQTLSMRLDLHGLRSDEAIEKTDKFISDALLAGFDEVLIYHGIGSGRLARSVREFLKNHPKVVSIEDAPPNMGGYGATLVKL